MAHKSKTQRAKAATTKANKVEREQRDEIAKAAAESEALPEEPKKGLFHRSSSSESKDTKSSQPVMTKKTEEKKPKKEHFKFLKDVRAEMKRVTWPTRQDVARWSGVVICALLFFGVYVAVLDNVIITPALIALSGLGA